MAWTVGFGVGRGGREEPHQARLARKCASRRCSVSGARCQV